MVARGRVRDGGRQLPDRALRTWSAHLRAARAQHARPGGNSAVRRISHLPVIVDAAHGTGRSYMVTPLARAGAAVGADGLMVEVHAQPEQALSDGAQTLTFDEYEQMVNEVRAIHKVIA